MTTGSRPRSSSDNKVYSAVQTVYDVPMNETTPSIEITQDYICPETGMMVWRRERFSAVNIAPDGCEVKTAGEYLFIPSTQYITIK